MPTHRAAAARPASRPGKSDDVTISVDSFRRILRELRLAARKTELATGLSAAQAFVLVAVDKTPGCSLNDIAASTMTDRTSVAAIVDRLIDGKYVTRSQADDDRRRASITITARGQRALAATAPPPTSLLVAGLRALSPTERSTLAQCLVVLTEKMGLADQPAGMLFEEDRAARAGGKRKPA